MKHSNEGILRQSYIRGHRKFVRCSAGIHQCTSCTSSKQTPGNNKQASLSQLHQDSLSCSGLLTDTRLHNAPNKSRDRHVLMCSHTKDGCVVGRSAAFCQCTVRRAVGSRAWRKEVGKLPEKGTSVPFLLGVSPVPYLPPHLLPSLAHRQAGQPELLSSFCWNGFN